MAKKIFFLLISTLFMCFAGFENKFPLLTARTVKYVDSAFSDLTQIGSGWYGYFLAHTSWGISLWLVIAFQSLLVAYLLYIFFKTFCSNENWLNVYLAYVFFITFLTSASFSVSTISPAIFYATALSAFLLLVHAAHLSTGDRYFVIFCLTFSVMVLPVVSIALTMVLTLVLIRKVLLRTPSLSIWIFPVAVILLIGDYVSFTAHDFRTSLTKLFESGFQMAIPVVDGPPFLGPANVKEIDKIAVWFNGDLREMTISSQFFKAVSPVILNMCELVIFIISIVAMIIYRKWSLSEKGILSTYCLLGVFFIFLVDRINMVDNDKTSLAWLVPLGFFLNHKSILGFFEVSSKDLSFYEIS